MGRRTLEAFWDVRGMSCVVWIVLSVTEQPPLLLAYKNDKKSIKYVVYFTLRIVRSARQFRSFLLSTRAENAAL